MVTAPTYPTSRVVKTAYGSVQGRRLVYSGEKQVDAFQGIPFAAPPVGELRFKKPVPPPSWDGVKKTDRFARRSIQQPQNPQDYAQNGVPSEDSLYLNVFTPCWEAPEGGFPVMVFIHGGWYMNGEASKFGDVGICENIVSRGIVFVTIQYRLGYLGFLSTGDDKCLGNFGLWDQTEALKWVQLNIEAFGGNKHNITLAGQSAGAASVDLLHLSPHSTGLFHKAICMAGSAECRWAMHPDMVKQTKDKVKRLGLVGFNDSEQLLAKLRTLPAEDFGVGFFSQIKEDHIEMESGPCIDGDFFPESLEALRKKATPKPFLLGVTEEEGLVTLVGRVLDSTKGLDETLKEATIDCTNAAPMKASLRSHFIGYAGPTNPDYVKAQVGMISDALFNAGISEHCRKTVAIQNEPVFLYVFEHFTPAIMGVLGKLMHFQSATHTSELFYLFKKGPFADPPMNDVERKVMNTFTTACTNFAKFGNPNGGATDIICDRLPTRWEPASKKNHALNYVITSNGGRMDDELFEGRTEDFIDIYDKYR